MSISTQAIKKNLTYLPMEVPLKNSKDHVIIDWYKDSDGDQTYAIWKQIIDEEEVFPTTTFDEKDFEYYISRLDAFVARCSKTGSVLGGFYVKPNSMGRSSHICNGGFAVGVDQRRKGIGEILYKVYLRIARDLGFEGSLFNLVYTINKGSTSLCRRLGYKQIGLLPKAAKLKDGYCDAIQFYYDLKTLNDIGEPACGWPK